MYMVELSTTHAMWYLGRHPPERVIPTVDPSRKGRNTAMDGPASARAWGRKTRDRERDSGGAARTRAAVYQVPVEMKLLVLSVP